LIENNSCGNALPFTGYSERFERHDMPIQFLLAWVCFTLCSVSVFVDAITYQIYHRSNEAYGNGQLTDVLVWYAFTCVTLDLLFSRMPLLPAHMVWTFVLVALDAIVCLAVYGQMRYSPFHLVVAFLIFAVSYIGWSMWTIYRDQADEELGSFEYYFSPFDSSATGHTKLVMPEQSAAAVAAAPAPAPAPDPAVQGTDHV